MYPDMAMVWHKPVCMLACKLHDLIWYTTLHHFFSTINTDYTELSVSQNQQMCKIINRYKMSMF
jgi:hypothetical protein